MTVEMTDRNEAARCATAIVWADPKLTPKKEET